MFSSKFFPWLKIIAFLPASGLLAGCMAAVGVDNKSLPPDAAERCAQHCESIGLGLSAVAIMADNVGCVCEARQETSSAVSAAKNTAAVAGGMTAIAMQADADQRNQQQRQSYQSN